jgi:flagellar protein FlbD
MYLLAEKIKNMIDVMRLDGKKYWINPHMIESMEENPDLTLTMLSGKKIIIRNSPEEVISKIIAYRRRIGMEVQEV